MTAAIGEIELERPWSPRYELFEPGERVQLLARRTCDDPVLRPGRVYRVIKINSDRVDPTLGAYTVTIQDEKGFRHCLPSTLFIRAANGGNKL